MYAEDDLIMISALQSRVAGFIKLTLCTIQWVQECLAKMILYK